MPLSFEQRVRCSITMANDDECRACASVAQPQCAANFQAHNGRLIRLCCSGGVASPAALCTSAGLHCVRYVLTDTVGCARTMVHQVQLSSAWFLDLTLREHCVHGNVGCRTLMPTSSSQSRT